MNKKISTEIGLVIIIIIAFILAVLIWIRSQGNKQVPFEIPNQAASHNPTLNQKQSVNSLNGPQAPTCDTKSNLVNWDESKNSFYYTQGEQYFTLSYPCDYKMGFSDVGSFYTLSNNNRGTALQYGLNISSAIHPNERVDIVKKLYKKTEVKLLNIKYKTKYSYDAYQVTIDKNEESPGECIECPGDSYYEIDLKVARDVYYNFTAPTSFDKNVLKGAVESFSVYHPF